MLARKSVKLVGVGYPFQNLVSGNCRDRVNAGVETLVGLLGGTLVRRTYPLGVHSASKEDLMLGRCPKESRSTFSKADGVTRTKPPNLRTHHSHGRNTAFPVGGWKPDRSSPKIESNTQSKNPTFVNGCAQVTGSSCLPANLTIVGPG